jgi:hypothetical protein
MFRRVLSDLDPKKWFDRMQPQTAMIATWLLYIQGAFTFLYWLDGDDIHGLWRRAGGPFSLLGFLSILAYPLGGFLMANGKRLGWWVALFAAFSPFYLRLLWKFDQFMEWSWSDVVVGFSYFNFMFEVALCALLLHTMTRNHVKTWLR